MLFTCLLWGVLGAQEEGVSQPVSRLQVAPAPAAPEPCLLDGQLGAAHSWAASMQQHGSGDHEQRGLRQPVCWTCSVLMD